jgi:glutathione synthase/RimK-type ligase-like ATP-grasp enzyme
MDSSSLLIISNKGDITTDLVVKRLYQRDISFRRFNTEEFPQNVSCLIKLNNGDNQFSITTANWELSSNDIKSIWYRRPKNPDFTNISFTQEEFIFAIRESNSFLLNLWAILKDKKWVNNPFDLYRAERKAFQLKIATNCGFNVPNTIITNNFNAVSEFIEYNHRNVIAKPISHGGFGKEDEYAIYTSDLENSEYVINKEDIQNSPFILQEKIKKKYDVRVSIFGTKIFAHKIQSKKDSDDIDWRVLNPYEITYELLDLDHNLQDKIIQFMTLLNLKYCAMDFVVDINENWYFIEINPNGQFAWLEIANGDKLIDSLIDLLWE